MITRTLRSYIKGNLLDLVDMKKFEPILLEGDDAYGRDDVIKARVTTRIKARVTTRISSSTSMDRMTRPNRADGLASRKMP
jgi:hypothetical protein